jgi:gluconate 2-dehydrogenase gamma chain
MSDETVSRRDLLRNIALSATLGGLSADAAQHVHQMAAVEKAAKAGVYEPKAFNAHEYQTLRRLAELIMPADEVSKGALEAGAPEFIDLLSSQNPELAAIYTGGIAWLDRQMERQHGKSFVDCKPEEQTALLDRIAYRRNATPELRPGIRFFDWARKMVADAYYTSKVGVADLGYMGNKGMTEFRVPAEPMNYALKRSNLG